jgi:hypothetical protein
LDRSDAASQRGKLNKCSVYFQVLRRVKPVSAAEEQINARPETSTSPSSCILNLKKKGECAEKGP